MQANHDALAGLRVLIVEDEVLVAMLIEEILEDLRCAIVGLAGTVEDAIAAVREHPVDGVLLDANLRGMNSSPVADELRDRGVPFLLVTGYGNRDWNTTVFATVPRVGKPIGFDELADGMLEAFVGADSSPPKNAKTGSSTQDPPKAIRL